jgi:HEAT repeat protein
VRDFAVNTLQVELPSGFLEHWTDGQALLLLDGLDEVAEDATRAVLVEKINCFLEAHSENWAVITSRPWGYRRDYFRTETYPHFELELFDEGQIQEFIEHWYGSRCDNAAQAQEMVRDLQDALKSKDRLQALVKNPLLLTMVALIHRYQDTLPKRRYKLYDKAVDTLLKSWERIKGKGETYGEFKHLDREDDLRRVMSLLARWIHTQYETQTTESGTLIEEVDLLAQLSHIIRQEYPQVKPHQAEGEAERFVSFIRDRAGLLNEYGRGRYAFVHKTFQEYLTAEAILKEAEYEDDSEIIFTVIKTHLHNPHWREVLLLLVGQLQGKKAEKAIEGVLRHNSPYEQWLHRDLLFAGRCLTEDPEKLATAAPELVSEILQSLTALETFDEKNIGSRVKQEMFQILCWLKKTAFEAEALKQLKKLKAQIEHVRFLHLQALLGEKNIALTTLLKLLAEEDPVESKHRIVETLGDLGDRSDSVINSLLNDLKEYPLSRTNFGIFNALSKLSDRSEVLSQKLSKLLASKNSYVRCNALLALDRLEDRSDFVLKILLNHLNDEASNVRSIALMVIGNFGDRSELVVGNLCECLNDEVSNVRSSAVEALVKLGNHSESVLQCLIKLFTTRDSDADSDVYYETAVALGTLGKYSESVFQNVIKFLKNENSAVRYDATIILGSMGNKSKLVVDNLLSTLKDESSEVRSGAAYALSLLADHSEPVIEVLLECLKDKDSNVRYHAADALGELNNSSKIVFESLFRCLKDSNPFVRLGTVVSLGKLGNYSESVVEVLLECIKDEDVDVRYHIADALGKLGDRSEAALQGLLALLQDEEQYVRSSAADALEKWCKSTPALQSTLACWIEQHSELPHLGSAIDALWQICA